MVLFSASCRFTTCSTQSNFRSLEHGARTLRTTSSKRTKLEKSQVLYDNRFSGKKIYNYKRHEIYQEKQFSSFHSCDVRGGSQMSTFSISDHEGTALENEYHRVFIAVGTNMGNRFHNLMKGISMLKNTDSSDIEFSTANTKTDSSNDPLIRIISTSYLRETAPMYVTDQPSFLNGAIEIETKLSPHALLKRLKDIECDVGRDLNGVRNGPRPIDLDIIYYGVTKESDGKFGNSDGGTLVLSEKLEIPHPRMCEREFVLAPLCDLGPNVQHPIEKKTSQLLLDSLQMSPDDSSKDVDPESIRVLPLPRGRMLSFNKTLIMGILNVTPDSFSDGGNYKGAVDLAVEQALKMEENGASIIDIGGESTRPGAKEVEVEIELERTIPVIKKIRKLSDIAISIDTRHSEVAKKAIEAGADIVNDVSGGMHDPLMLKTVSELAVPMVLMHMRGSPETMQAMTQYDNVVIDVASSLISLSEKAEIAGIHKWMQVLDPGIGFAKNLKQNLSLLKNNDEMRKLINDCPLLLGPSRKGFIGKITGETKAEERDFGTLAACLAALQDKNGKLAPTILRVHNVKAVRQGVDIFEAILNAK